VKLPAKQFSTGAGNRMVLSLSAKDLMNYVFQQMANLIPDGQAFNSVEFQR
jgi:hypothetical protein